MAKGGSLYIVGIFLPIWTFMIYIFGKELFLIRKYQKIDSTYTALSQRVKEQYDTSRRRNYFPKVKLSRNSYDDYTLNYTRQNDSDSFHLRENATILMLVRNSELEGALDSMRSLEDRFNNKYHYDWTFLNDVPFDQDFIEATTSMASGKTQYALIPPEDWNRPQWINDTLFEERLRVMEDEGVLYDLDPPYKTPSSSSHIEICVGLILVFFSGSQYWTTMIITLGWNPMSSIIAISPMTRSEL